MGIFCLTITPLRVVLGKIIYMGKVKKQNSLPVLQGELKKLKRYDRIWPMFYRNDMNFHMKRVEALVEEFLPLASVMPNFNNNLAKLIAGNHDNHEVYPKLGDVPLQMKLIMSVSELEELHNKEIFAARVISQKYPLNFGNFTHEELLLHAIRKNTAEAHLFLIVIRWKDFVKPYMKYGQGILFFWSQLLIIL